MGRKRITVLILASFLTLSCDSNKEIGQAKEFTVDDSTVAYLEGVFNRVSHLGSELNVEFVFVSDGAAFAQSTEGVVRLSTAMLHLIHNEAELACLLAHELGHHSLGHVNERKGAERPYSADQEIAADAIALETCAKAGYAPIAYLDLIRRVTLILEGVPASSRELPETAQERINSGLAIIVGLSVTSPTNYFTGRYYAHARGAGSQLTEYIDHRDSDFLNFLGPIGVHDVAEAAVGCTDLISDTYGDDPALYKDVKEKTNDWLRSECTAENVKAVPSNYYDAFGHCYFACRAESYGAGCADLGIAREEARELGAWIEENDPKLGEFLREEGPKALKDIVKEHDSYYPDINNNRAGVDASRDEGDCYWSCANAADLGRLDFSAPQRAFIECNTLEELENPRAPNTQTYELKMTGDCSGALRSSTHKFRNNKPYPIEYYAQTEGESTEATINNTGVLGVRKTVEIQIDGGCICQCGSPSAGLDKLVIRATRDDSDIPVLDGEVVEEVPMTISCSAVPEDCGGSSGEPHIATMGKLAFDFQAAGEFVLARTEDGIFEVQTRQRPWARGNNVTLNTAVAVGIAEHRVGVYRVSGDPKVLVNGKSVELQDFEKRELGSDGSVQRFGLTYVIQDNVGRSAVVKVYPNNLNVLVHVPPNTEIVGLLGGDDSENLPTLRDGRIIDAPVLHNQLYGEFADSWALRQEESLFDYESGKGPEDYRDKRIPMERFTVDNLSSAQRQHGEEVCRTAGVTNPIELENCTLDVGLTGDASFADPAFSADYPLRPLQIGFAPTTQSNQAMTGKATLSFPTSAAAGSSIAVRWTGPANDRDYISLARKEQIASHYSVYSYLAEDTDTVTLRVPGIPGNYEIRYVIDRDSQVIASAPLEVTPVTATLDAPTQAGAGSSIAVRWTGPANDRDYISLARKEQIASHYSVYSYLAEDTDTVTLRVPGIPGNYEIRYVIDRDSQVIASAPLEVTPVTATLDAPDTAEVDSIISVKWSGPANYRDYITLARKEQIASHYLVYSYLADDTDTITLRTPGEPGQYVIRYVIDRDSQIVASIPITIK